MPRRPWSGWTESCSRWAPPSQSADAGEALRRVAGHQDHQGRRQVLLGAGVRKRADGQATEDGVGRRLQRGQEGELVRAGGPDGVHRAKVA